MFHLTITQDIHFSYNSSNFNTLQEICQIKKSSHNDIDSRRNEINSE